MKHLFVVLVILLSVTVSANADYNWNWDSGTFESWERINDWDTEISIVSGRNGTFGIGIYGVAAPPYMKSLGNDIDPLSISEIYIDVDRAFPSSGYFFKIDVYGTESTVAYSMKPSLGTGSIELLSDGWYRHRLESTGVSSYDGQEAGKIRLIFADDDSEGELVRFDNLTMSTSPAAIVPEPVSTALFIVGGASLGLRHFRKRFKA